MGKLLLGATGSYVSLLRVLWLASVVTWLAVIPVVGAIVAGIWFLLIMLVTFENIDGLERLQALVLVVAVGALMLFRPCRRVTGFMGTTRPATSS